MLTDKQKRFVEEYLIDLNATQAAVRAGYSEKTARSVGSENLTKPDIMAAIEEAQKARSERTGITADRVLTELAKIGFYDIRKAVKWGANPGDKTSENADPNGLNIYPVSLVPSEKLDDDTAAAVAEVSLTQTGVKLKMHDKRAALVDIGRHLGMFKEKVEHSGPDGGAIPLTGLNVAFIKPNAS
ncbi:terminase small subunit [Microvirga lotononidis]|uniref:Phage terminase, small subunit n=1 Tax=Microvirga lotononidis TaxID=864069 RepID=I4YP48_9HYPH|nr:terminase small subunit [Microvirga lotononidis]EIM25740.1 phage terminase, small subunit [Microvirga lotononidis]WQO25669.1 terminase small subunit [Microvirga lotononidis]